MKKIVLFIGIIAVCGLLILAYPAFNAEKGTPTWMREIPALEVAFDQYKKDHGIYPQGTSSEIARKLLGENPLKRTYFEARTKDEGFILDPWGRPYRFSYYNDAPVIRSYAEDGKFSEDDKTNR
ncbi:MAG: hypothetical protein HC904_07865 [Blastochloris sp.]|nr:hypothetical protein [Blastochloris sp.]